MAATVRLMTQNVLFGGQDRFDALCAVLAAARPDVLCLQECVGWDDGQRLRTLARTLAIPEDERHMALSHSNPRGSGMRYHVALLSRPPIRQVRAHQQGFAHSLLEASISLSGDSDDPQAPALTLFGAHLCAADEDLRLAEVEVLLSHVQPALLRQAPLVLLGDLNALSPEDPYPDDLGLRFSRLGIRKYGPTPRYDVMRRLLSTGLHDPLPRRKPGTPWVTAVRGYRPPAPVTDEVVDTRTDYVLLGPHAAPLLRDCGVIHVGTASDHHGVYADLRLGRSHSQSS